MLPKGFPLETFLKYSGLALPRHVSYPMPTAWSDKDGEDYVQKLSETDPNNPLSIYLHIPFCETLCKFCACNRVILKKSFPGAEEKKRKYIDALKKELHLFKEKTQTQRPVMLIHYGGGSPTYLEPEEIAEIQNTITELFNVRPEAEISMEIDPRHADQPLVDMLGRLGFNRISMGIQDFDIQVQEHVHRLQSLEMVKSVTQSCRDAGLGQVNFDLIYGMPYQTLETVRDMVEKAISLGPDRVAFYHYAQIPDKIATQRGMDYTKLPTSEEKLEMFLEACEVFTDNGYDLIGLDHFAKSDDGLAVAYRNGTIQRNFQGMTTHRGLDLVGFGVSSISHLQGVGYWQSEKEAESYEEVVESGKLPQQRGIHFSEDDRIRQSVIADLYCFGTFDPQKVSEEFGIDAQKYFEKELRALEELSEDGIVHFREDGVVEATFPLGRVLLRNIGSVFDAYLDPDAYKVGDKFYFSVSA
ncbi:MAG: oxygen-independent coproporphyrinogen III oxidase [Candidatus Omnitrophica bacterium]|nr:oxygen-independent coproporphyrinogen III oxidase [Candidatus Omnitrophota bacterium]MCB9782452.1 oxygen-independent coproporphyrinogen III oxidase [Candidatus Omnitrophota bacterium]